MATEVGLDDSSFQIQLKTARTNNKIDEGNLQCQKCHDTDKLGLVEFQQLDIRLYPYSDLQ